MGQLAWRFVQLINANGARSAVPQPQLSTGRATEAMQNVSLRHLGRRSPHGRRN
jgi:hypothetical protein